MSVTVPPERAEQARAVMLELFPEGFEESDGRDGVELAAYTNAAGEERLWQAFGGAMATDVEADWEDRWRSFHRPVRVGPLWIGPPWEEPPPEAIAVVIDPGRAFGTGAHPTTRLCVEFLLGCERGSLLDAGCGSGVIAIAAAKLGFGPVVALDSDPVAVEVAAANAAANGVLLDVLLGDAVSGSPLPAAGLTVANITLEATGLVAERARSPRLILSGYIASERPRLGPFTSVRRHECDGWAADFCVRERG